ncbi:hypothetical protein CDAR_320881 [Caerostris darwini]|uniref:Uncharacterized protein n=1 Tax=Caerostris darwini TaxID=1538125 RepID=A0AAV4X0V5_9ARAC|nr:hypothetical protein CDAR_320881 [Caerostris darwini]
MAKTLDLFKVDKLRALSILRSWLRCLPHWKNVPTKNTAHNTVEFGETEKKSLGGFLVVLVPNCCRQILIQRSRPPC